MSNLTFPQIIIYLWEIGYDPKEEEFSDLFDSDTILFFFKIACYNEFNHARDNPTDVIFKELAESLNSLSSQLDSMIDFSANIEYKSPEFLKMAFYVQNSKINFF